ncbi:MAG: alpha/beta hydrolase fold domain-containing protein [Coprobacter sp.]|nr:alpha/beta hydrolase fold domain-containing protein [Coprobacter sp.]
MKRFLLLAAGLLFGLAVSAQSFDGQSPLRIDLTPDGAAHMLVFLPEQPTGRAVVCCPGGGYTYLATAHEGTDWVDYFVPRGITFAVVNYRMPHGDRNIPVSDVENAMRTMRDSAAVWHLNVRDIGIMGFSAGGHLASTIATQSPYELRPDFQILFYPVITMGRGTHAGSMENFLGEGRTDKDLVEQYSNERRVRRNLTPPAILLLTHDDRGVPPVPNGVAYYSAMRNAGNSCSLHIYPSGGHGFGYNAGFTYRQQMLDDLSAWLDNLPAPNPDAIRVACIGNSITEGYGIDLSGSFGYPALLQQMLGDRYNVRNFGISARTLLRSGDYPYMREPVWTDAQAFRPDIAVIKLGTNDSKDHNWEHKADFAGDLETMIRTLQALPSHPRIYLCTPIPAFKSTWTINDRVIADEMIPILKEAVSRYGLAGLIDLHTAFAGDGILMQDDGIHPNDAGVRKIAEVIARSLCPECR